MRFSLYVIAWPTVTRANSMADTSNTMQVSLHVIAFVTRRTRSKSDSIFDGSLSLHAPAPLLLLVTSNPIYPHLPMFFTWTSGGWWSAPIGAGAEQEQ